MSCVCCDDCSVIPCIDVGDVLSYQRELERKSSSIAAMTVFHGGYATIRFVVYKNKIDSRTDALPLKENYE